MIRDAIELARPPLPGGKAPWPPLPGGEAPWPPGSPAPGGDALLARAVALAGAGAWSCDLADERLRWTAGVYDLFGLPRGAAVARHEAAAMYDPASRHRMERLRADAIVRRAAFSLDARIVRADGTPRWMRLTGAVLCSGGRPVQLYGLKQDITAEHERWETLRRLAEQDPLTGLAGRRVFEARFLDGDPARMPAGALVLFDLDGFKQVNDRHGHAAGDACLRAVGDRLRAAFPRAPMIARIGGDEFALLAGPGADAGPALARRVAAALDRLARPVAWRDRLLRIGASAGIAAAADPCRYDAQALFAAADAALYAAKRAGRNRVRQAPAAGAGAAPLPGGAALDGRRQVAGG